MKRDTIRLTAALIAGLIPVVFLISCATIMQGTTQTVGISSSPSGALVTVDGKAMGKTPVMADLKRKDNHTVQIKLAAYEPHEMTITRSLSGWVVGNILFGGLIGLAVDAITGGMYKLTPAQINGELVKSVATTDGDILYVAVVLEPDPSWEKIGQLVPTQGR